MSRPPLAPVATSSQNSRTSLGPSSTVARKSIITTSNMNSSNNGTQVGRKSLGVKQEDSKSNQAGSSRLSVLPQGQPRTSLAPNVRPGTSRPSISSRPSLSTNRRNSRGSISQTNSRESLSRRTSVYGQGETQLKDPRPIKEKPFINSCIHRLVQYLTDNYYDKPINPQTLVCPSSRDFFSILEFLLRKVDPSFSFKDPKKPEDEALAMFKALRYPFGMSSRSLHSVGTPHAWPTFLAALHWLIELLTYDEFSQMQRDELMQEEASQEALLHSFFIFVSQAYQAFMSANDALEEELAANFLRTLEDANEERREAIAAKQEHTKQLQQECHNLRHHETRVHILSEQLAKQEKELEKFKEYVRLLDQKNQVTSEKLALEKKQAAAEKEAVERLQIEVKAAEKRLSEQLSRNLDAERLQQEMKNLNRSISFTVTHRDEIEKDSWNIEMEISQKFAEVEKSVSAFNQHIRATGLLSSLRSELRVNPQDSAILSMDLKGTVKPVLLAYLDAQRKAHQDNQETMVEMHTKADQMQDELSSKRSEVADLTSRLEGENASLQKLKKSYDDAKKLWDSQILSLEREIENLSNADKDILAIREKQKLETIVRIKEKETHAQNELKQLHELACQYTEWIVEHQDYISKKLSQVSDSLLKQIDAAH